MRYQNIKKAYIEKFETEFITNLLYLHGGNVSYVAADMEMDRCNLLALMRKYKIKSKEFKKK